MRRMIPKPPAALAAWTGGWMVLAAWNLWASPSYWIDELFAVTISLAEGAAFWQRWILPDVHPPLYPLALKTWMGAFGAGEMATRALSVLMAWGALLAVALAWGRRAGLLPWAAVGLLGSAAGLAYYAQETRAYAAMLCLSTLATLQWLALWRRAASFPWWHALTLWALSLIHYFGLIAAGLMLIGLCLRPQPVPQRLWLVLHGAGMLVWPLLHAGWGRLAEVSGGRFWIPYEGLGSTLAAWLSGTLAWPWEAIGRLHAMAGLPAAFAVAALLLGLGAVGWHAAARVHRREVLALAGLLLAFVLTVALVDLHTPISTPRNHLVMLPAMSLLLALALDGWHRMAQGSRAAWLPALALGVFVAGAVTHRQAQLASKWAPHQNIRAVWIALADAQACQPHCRVTDAREILSTYGGLALLDRPLALRDGALSELDRAAAGEPAPMIAWWLQRADARRLQALGWRCQEPAQDWPGAIAVLHRLPQPLPGLQDCR